MLELNGKRIDIGSYTKFSVNYIAVLRLISIRERIPSTDKI